MNCCASHGWTFVLDKKKHKTHPKIQDLNWVGNYLQDKTMADKLMYIFNVDSPNNQSSIKVPMIVKPTNENHYFKTLGD